jgi:hypothetical protein
MSPFEMQAKAVMDLIHLLVAEFGRSWPICRHGRILVETHSEEREDRYIGTEIREYLIIKFMGFNDKLIVAYNERFEQASFLSNLHMQELETLLSQLRQMQEMMQNRKETNPFNIPVLEDQATLVELVEGSHLYLPLKGSEGCLISDCDRIIVYEKKRSQNAIEGLPAYDVNLLVEHGFMLVNRDNKTYLVSLSSVNNYSLGLLNSFSAAKTVNALLH